jgi:hypothetical protein
MDLQLEGKFVVEQSRVKPLSGFVNCCALQDGNYQRERDETSCMGHRIAQTKSTRSVDDVVRTSIRGVRSRRGQATLRNASHGPAVSGC